jgi:tetratricopeptide (TPR) repeat protein
MAIEDIERLKEKIEKDPNSKLFVPLAEEYKKAGMLDEAIDVLTKGLERQPGYLSARVSLGKIYIEKRMLNESQAEFEKVVTAIPDNLYAHKKLAEIYSDLGDKDKAEKEFLTVLKLNPTDEWALSSLSALKEKPASTQEQRDEQAGEISSAEQVATPIEVEETPDISISEEDLELGEFHAQTDEVPKQEEIAAESSAGEEEIDLWELPDEEITEIKEEIEEKPVEISVSEETAQVTEPSIEPFEEAEEELTENVIEIEEVPEDSISFEGLLEESEISEKAEEKAAPGFGMTDADSYIVQGQYAEALNIYRKLLSDDPENRYVMQRIEELRSLLKLLGKDREALIETLDAFLEGIRKRRNEFFGSS